MSRARAARWPARLSRGEGLRVSRSPDGRYVFLSLSRPGRVAILEAASRKLLGYLAAGERPDGVAYTTRVIPVRP
ncbi:MAG TPA: hypothetical protein VGQ69_02175 [Gemmatimonadales bacterium]|nr:hypothetical protein [Gemmatimonadales bacterium]